MFPKELIRQVHRYADKECPSQTIYDRREREENEKATHIINKRLADYTEIHSGR